MNTGLMQRDHIGVTFHHKAVILLDYIRFGLVDTVNDLALVVHIRFRTVDVLGHFLIAAEGSSAKGDHTARKVMDREHDAAFKTVEQLAIAFQTKTGIYQVFLIVLFFQRLISERIVAIETITQFKFLDGFLRETALLEIAETDGLTFFGLEQV